MPKMSKYLLYPLFSIILSGCVTSPVTSPILTPVDPTNYRDKLSIERADKEFFSGRYIGLSKGCFPPISNKLCQPVTEKTLKSLSIIKGSDVYEKQKSQLNKPIYEKNDKLLMEEFQVRISSSGTPSYKLVRDLVFLSGAGLAQQLGYPYMTRLNTTTADKCSSIYSTSTYGSMNANKSYGGYVTGSYSGKTYLNEDIVCHKSESGDFLFFQNESDLKNGVFYRYGNQDNWKSKNRDKLFPEKRLYIGTIPYLMGDDYVKEEYGIIHLSNSEAWKDVYDTAGLLNDLRKKYKIDKSLPYEYKDKTKERLEKDAEKSKDPLETNKLPVNSSADGL